MFFPKILRENRHRDFKSFIFPQRKLKKCKAPMSKLLSVHLYIIIWQITVMTKLKSLQKLFLVTLAGTKGSRDSLGQHKETKEQLYLMQTSKATRRHGCGPTYPSYLPENSSSRTGGHSWKSWNLPHIPLLLLLPLSNSAQSEAQFLFQGTL